MNILVEKEAEDFLEKEGFLVVKRALVKTEKELLKNAGKIGYPIVLKVYSKKILHKSEVKGVKTDIRNDKEAINAFKEIMRIKDSEGCLIQEFISGDSFLVGLKKDPNFNHVIVFGLGGIYTEVIKDVSLRVCPVDLKEIRAMMRETKSFKILSGARGKKRNIGAVEKLLHSMSKLSQKHHNIKELDINPLIVNENSAIIADARIILE